MVGVRALTRGTVRCTHRAGARKERWLVVDGQGEGGLQHAERKIQLLRDEAKPHGRSGCGDPHKH
jgi:hypothetical protein